MVEYDQMSDSDTVMLNGIAGRRARIRLSYIIIPYREIIFFLIPNFKTFCIDQCNSVLI